MKITMEINDGTIKVTSGADDNGASYEIETKKLSDETVEALMTLEDFFICDMGELLGVEMQDGEIVRSK